MDEDGNGVLSTSELGDAMTALGVSIADDDLTDVMHEIDTNGRNPCISFILDYYHYVMQQR